VTEAELLQGAARAWEAWERRVEQERQLQNMFGPGRMVVVDEDYLRAEWIARQQGHHGGVLSRMIIRWLT
jgi:hypothetical protein